MSYRIQKIAVLGSGVMGRQIAAHCANAGFDVLMLDIASKDDKDRNALVKKGLDGLLKMKPAPLASPGFAKRIQIGNFDDDWNKLEEADWICEVVIEQMDIKQKVMSRIDEVRRADAIVTTNTSGLPLTEMSEYCSESFKKHFLGTHFFNPPRYMKLLEAIPTAHTDPAVFGYMSGFAGKLLGKGVVNCKDTPNFIANRIGVFSMASIMPWVFSKKLRIEEVDFLTGIFSGYSKAATFRTADMVGIDVLGHVARNLYPNIPDDERRELFKLPDTLQKMIDEGLIGNKAGQGFYKKVRTKEGTQYLVLNVDTLDYEPQQDISFPSVDQAKEKYKTTGERLRFMINQDDRAGRFLWEIHRDLFLYAANRIPEITDSIEEIERAMQWGFNWEMSPFEKWDAVGVKETTDRMKKEGFDIPGSVEKMLASGRSSFYDHEKGTFYNLATGKVEPQTPPIKGAVLIPDLYKTNKVVFRDKETSLIDMGEGVALFEFHSKGHTLGQSVIEGLFKSIDLCENEFQGMVIGNDGANFSLGANLYEVLTAVSKNQFDLLTQAVTTFQDASRRIRYSYIPVIVTPYNQTLGGGCEFMLHADRVVAYHELYAGLVEVGVGLIPAGCGTTEVLRRSMNRMPDDNNVDPLIYLKEAFQQIGMAKVATSAHEARQMNLLRQDDPIVMNRDLQLRAARESARAMAEAGYRPPATGEIYLMGKEGYSALKLSLYIMHEAGYISDYDQLIGERLAYIMTGGLLNEPQYVPESYVHKLEREVFLELLHEKKTGERIEYTLKKGRPLRN